VARGTQHLRKRPQQDAPKPRTHGRRKPNTLEEELFFERLRRHAKWAYIGLAVVFALSFAFLGVGSGSSGLSEFFQNAFSFGGNSATGSISKLQEETRKHPTDATAFRDLATALETKNRTDEAINALERYAALRPKDADGLQELALQYTKKASDLSTEAQAAQAEAPLASRSDFLPPSTTPLGKLYADTNVLGDPIEQAVTSLVNEKTQKLADEYRTVQTKTVSTYTRLAALDPADAQTQALLGYAALQANDVLTAKKAFQRYIKLAPDGPDAARVKQILKQLSAQPASGSSGG
jgi:tetratricopeptide (TPR) repeat protein